MYSRNGLSSPQEKLIAFNRHTGEQLWEWTDFIYDSDQFWTGEHYLHNNVLVLSSGARIYALDITSGQTMWSSWDYASSGQKDVTGLGSTIFHTKYSLTNPNVSEIRYRDIYSGDWQTILEVTWGDGFESYVGGISPYIDAVGDTLLFFTEGAYHFSEKVGGRKLWAYNLTDRKVLYEVLYHPPSIHAAGSIVRPIVYKDKIDLMRY